MFGNDEFNLFLTQQAGRDERELVSLEASGGYKRPKTVNLPPKPMGEGEFASGGQARASATPNIKSRRPAARIIPPAPSLSDHLPTPDDPILSAKLRAFQARYDLSSLTAEYFDALTSSPNLSAAPARIDPSQVRVYGESILFQKKQSTSQPAARPPAVENQPSPSPPSSRRSSSPGRVGNSLHSDNSDADSDASSSSPRASLRDFPQPYNAAIQRSNEEILRAARLTSPAHPFVRSRGRPPRLASSSSAKASPASGQPPLSPELSARKYGIERSPVASDSHRVASSSSSPALVSFAPPLSSSPHKSAYSPHDPHASPAAHAGHASPSGRSPRLLRRLRQNSPVGYGSALRVRRPSAAHRLREGEARASSAAAGLPYPAGLTSLGAYRSSPSSPQLPPSASLGAAATPEPMPGRSQKLVYHAPAASSLPAASSPHLKSTSKSLCAGSSSSSHPQLHQPDGLPADSAAAGGGGESTTTSTTLTQATASETSTPAPAAHPAFDGWKPTVLEPLRSLHTPPVPRRVTRAADTFDLKLQGTAEGEPSGCVERELGEGWRVRVRGGG